MARKWRRGGRRSRSGVRTRIKIMGGMMMVVGMVTTKVVAGTANKIHTKIHTKARTDVQ
jgi:hypothetical protein